MLYLVFDGLNTFLRNYATNPTMDSNGESVGGLVGTIRSVKAMVREVKPDVCVFVWDGEGGSRRRRGIFSEYKAGRKPRLNRQYDFGESPEAAEKNMRYQMAKAKEYLSKLSVVQVEVDGIEADDAIAYLSRWRWSSDKKVIVSSDKDFLQLVDASTVVYSPTKKVYYGPDQIKDRFGVLAENYVLLKCLVGDASDNVDGVFGIGEKSVAKLFPFLAEKPSTLAEVVEHAKASKKKGTRYLAVSESVELLERNMSLMQLTSPTISRESIAAVRKMADEHPEPIRSTDVRLALVRDGIPITDADMLAVFRELSARSQQAFPATNGDNQE